MIDLAEIKAAIAAHDRADWEAGDTEAFRRGKGASDGDGLGFGLRLADNTGALKAASDLLFETLGTPPPPSIDWRSHGGGRVTPVKDQGACGACVAFATCAAMEASEWIRSGNVHDLSEGDLFHCNGGSCANGWGLTHGVDAAGGGVGISADQPWSADPQCLGIAKILRVKRFRLHRDLTARKRAVANAPVLAGMAVYEDFMAYRSGVYRHVVGDKVGYHAVCVVGYDDAIEAWIVKNSWGTGFGDDGFFLIAYGEAEIDTLDFASVETGS